MLCFTVPLQHQRVTFEQSAFACPEFNNNSTPLQKVELFVFKNKDYDMQRLTVHCCQKEIALMPADVAAGFYCPYCGRIVK